MGRPKIRPQQRRIPMAHPAGLDQLHALAVRCQSAGLNEQAKQLYIRILEGNPDHALALNNLSIIASGARDFQLATELSARAVSLSPENADLHACLGIALAGNGDPERADAAFRRAVVLNPDCVDALYNWGNALQARGLLRDAGACFEKVVILDPHHVLARNNLGLTYLSARRFDEAEACFRTVLREKPDWVMGPANLALVLEKQGRYTEAEAFLRQALRIEPNHTYLLVNLGQVLISAKRVGEAVECLEKAMRVSPFSAELGLALARGYATQGRGQEACALWKRALALQPAFSAAYSAGLFMLHYDPALSPEQLAGEHRAWAVRFAVPLYRPGRPHANTADPERTLRIGYVSGDFRRHPIAFFMMPVLANHHHSRVEAFCYAGGVADSWTPRIRALASHWRDVEGIGDADLAQMIEQDEIDILVDLSGHTTGNRLLTFACKPAPIQITWLGYFNTTGLPVMDYLIADDQIAPPEEEAPFVEQVLRLPGCYLTYQTPSDAPPVSALPALERGYVTYGSFNALSKVGAHVVSVWADILKRTPGSRLVMKNPTFEDAYCRRLYQQHFERCGIAAERIDLLGPSPHDELLAHYSEIDIALDPFPYNGGTTTCEALAMGVPVVGMRGDRFVSRAAATLLHNAGLDELMTNDPEEYIEKAIALGRDVASLAVMRANMRNRLAQSTLYDSAGFTRNLEHAYREVWRRWCAQQH